jgi:type 2 lantibiotic biosynthesis protein LanM
MAAPGDGTSAWWRACTIEERCAAGGILALASTTRPDAPEVADQRLRAWRSQSPFQSGGWLGTRLAVDNLDESTFCRLLGESEESLRRRIGGPLAWACRLEKAFGDGRTDDPRERIPLVGPLITRSAGQLGQLAESLGEHRPQLSASLHKMATQLVTSVITRVDNRLSRAVVFEMRLAAARGELAGADPEARFQGFLKRLRDSPAALAFWRDYPVLARCMVSAIDGWTAAGCELMTRLAEDWEEIANRFWAGRTPGPLSQVQVGLGDSHRHGRTVCMLRFATGELLVYKPRSLHTEMHFARLLRWLHERGGLDLRMPLVLDRPDYGWCEHVAPSPCADRAAAGRFYRRQGALLATLYLLSSCDIHRENLVAAGEFPVPVDLETLCEHDYGQLDERSHDSQAELDLARSVVKILLLPYLQEGKGRRVLELSALGGAPGQPAINPRPQWEGLGTDELALSYSRPLIAATPNRPTLNGEPLSAFDFAAEIEEGFTATYRLILQHRRELQAASGPLTALRTEKVRVILRATELYSLILEQSFHPAHLGDALERERLFDRLWFGSDRTAYPEVAQRLVASERRDLWDGDIPYFTARVDSRDLEDSRGHVLPGFFSRSGWEVVRARIDQLGEDDLAQQVFYIRGSLTAIHLNSTASFDRYAPPAAAPACDRERLLACAGAIGRRIARLARWRGGYASWVGLACGETAGWHLRALGSDLYSGLPGIILFLAYLSAVSGRDSEHEVIQGALAMLRKEMRRRHAGMEFVGGFDGWGGLLYLWLHLAHLWRDDQLLQEASSMVGHLREISGATEHLDVIQGTAGAIVPLLLLYEMNGFTPARDLARTFGEQLMAQARPCNGGAGWITNRAQEAPLTGFSHGAAGIAWALSELAAATGETAFAAKAREAVAFERSYFSPAAGNWADLRQAEAAAPPRYMAAWCHGACGIGLSRFRMQQRLRDDELREEMRIAAETTYREGFGSNHSLCHGDLGSIDLLLHTVRAIPDEIWQSRLQEKAAHTLASIEQHGARSGVPLDVETPGLMDGLAGIGYGLLRLAAPERVPSVLLLEGPPSGYAHASTASNVGKELR